MNTSIPYKKLFVLLLVTAPLFGFFAATPLFVFGPKPHEKIPFNVLLVTLTTLVFWLVNIYLLYLSSKFYPLTKQWKRYLLSVLITGIMILLVFFLFFPMKQPHPVRVFPGGGRPFMPHKDPGIKFLFFPFLQTQSVNAIILILIEMVLLREHTIKMEDENRQLRLLNVEAKNILLKQQLHPHFLFNSLSTLRSLIKRNVEEAQDYLDKLAELLRFSSDNANRVMIGLEEEIGLCEQYLSMQKVRFGDALEYTVQVPSTLSEETKIPVYAIQIAVENAIKHNVLTAILPLRISITANEADKTIAVVNNLQPKHVIETTNGIGLKNLAERYQLLGDKQIVVKKTNSEFIIIIPVFV